MSIPEVKIISTLLENKEKKINISRLSKLTKIGLTNIRGPLTELENRGLISTQISEKDKRKKYVRISDNSYLKVFFASSKIDKK